MDWTFGFRDQGSDIVKVSQGFWCWGENRTEPGMAMDVSAVPVVGKDSDQAKFLGIWIMEFRLPRNAVAPILVTLLPS